jgi:hypothetical protein
LPEAEASVSFAVVLSEGYPESFRGLSQKSYGFSLRFFITFEYLGFNPGLILRFFTDIDAPYLVVKNIHLC